MEFIAVLGGALTFLLGAMAALGRLLIAQFERRLDERFVAFDTRFAALERAAQEEPREWQRVEREILTIKADLPIHYVRREDYIRNQSIIEAKLDGLAVRIENALLRGEHLSPPTRKAHD